MISKITESNRDKMLARLKEISMAIYGDETSINDLESYYGHIRDIAALTTNFKSAPYKYFFMPIDEPVFEIDANKRTITVPQHFSKNGIGVHGDHKAEILYFRVDQYFDYQDLYTVDSIIINWQFRPANASRNAEIETHTSYALAPDNEYDPGHIMFGWVIDSSMTPSKGTLSFSVSFLKKTGGQYDYVLNTLISSVNVNDSIVLDDPTVLDSLEHPIFERLVNSRYTPGTEMPLLDPVFRSSPVTVREDGHDVVKYKGLPSVMNFAIDQNGVEDEELYLQAIGYTTDEGIVKYTWHGTTSDGVSVDQEADIPTSQYDYVITSDTLAPTEGVTYYVLEGNEMKTLEEANIDVSDRAAFQQLVQSRDVYELGSSLKVSSAGEYLVSIQSKKEITQSGDNKYIRVYDVTEENFADDTYYTRVADSENEGSFIYTEASSYANNVAYYTASKLRVNSGSVESQSCEVPMAAVPSVSLVVTSAVTPETAVPSYSIYDEDLASQYIFIADGTPTDIKAMIGIDPEQIYNVETGEGIKGFSANSTLGAIALKLTDADSLTEEEIAALTSAESDSLYRAVDATGLDVDSDNVDGEGTYKVFAINRRNHTYNISKPSEAIEVRTIAPVIDSMSVFLASDLENALISNNAKNGDAEIRLTGEENDFVITTGAIKEGVALQLRVLELDTRTEFPEGTPIYEQVLPATEDGDLDHPTRYLVKSFDQEIAENNSYSFTTKDYESGKFIVQATTRYCGTERISYTEPFTIWGQ